METVLGKALFARRFVGRAHRVLVRGADFVDRQSPAALGLFGVAAHRRRGVFAGAPPDVAGLDFRVAFDFTRFRIINRPGVVARLERVDARRG